MAPRVRAPKQIKSKFRFDCFKKGHIPHPFTPTETIPFGKDLYVGRVCAKCLVLYFEPTGLQVRETGVLDARGRDLRVEESKIV